MFDVPHSPTCLAERETVALAATRWRQRWPNHCPVCQGRFVLDEPHPDVQVFAPALCPRCAELETCARCGKPIGRHDAPCPACAWNWGASPGDSVPRLPELCDCQMAQLMDSLFIHQNFVHIVS